MVGKTPSGTTGLRPKSSRSPARTKSPSRPKSPSRTKSPSRSPGRVRKPKTPDSPEPPPRRAKSKSPGRMTEATPPKTKIPSRRAASSPKRTSPVRAKPEAKVRPGTPNRMTVKGRSPVRAGIVSSTPIDRDSPLRKSRSVSKERLTNKIFTEILLQKETNDTVVLDSESESSDPEFVPIKEKPKATVRGRTRQPENESGIQETFDVKKGPYDAELTALGLQRRVTRSSTREDSERVVHLKTFSPKRLGEFSDEDDPKPNDEVVVKPSEFGGAVGSLLAMIGIPGSVALLCLACNESQCSFVRVPSIDARVSRYLDGRSQLGVTAYVLLLSLLSALPFGGKRVTALPSRHGKFTYVMNGLFDFVLLLSLIVGLEYEGVRVAEYVVGHLTQVLVGVVLLGLVTSVSVHLRSFYVPVSALNTYAVGRSGVYGFFMGRETNPRPFGVVDLKLVFFRVFVIGSILLDLMVLYTSLVSWTPKTPPEPLIRPIQPTLLIYVLLRSIYHLDYLLFEPTWVTTFACQQEAFGYMLAMLFSVLPLANVTGTKYVADYGVELEPWKLGVASLAFVFGYVLCRGSNNQKDSFRKNPYSPALTHLETIPTTQGKKLLSSGFWGVVRHPNYLGDIVMQLSFLPFLYNAPPVLLIVVSVLLLLYRSRRDHLRCKQKYGSAWDRYCNKVRYCLLPRVY